MQTLRFDEFLRSLKQNKDTPHSLLLGAGASVESGIPSASDCVWDWKREIFLSQNPGLVEVYSNIKIDNVRLAVQKWLDGQKIYPALNSDDEYSFYAERTFPIPDDRRKYFQNLVSGKKPSLGYHIISMLSELGMIKTVWTTNFDGLMLKCAHQYCVNPIEITAETADRIYRSDVDSELLCIALHGDYKYGSLKNTSEELDSQNDIFVSALRHELADRDLIVLGYSGRDKSLMTALHKAYQAKGAGKLLWCGYGMNAHQAVIDLIQAVNDTGRIAYYIPTDGFDKTIYSMARHCMSENKVFLQKIDALKKELGTAISMETCKFETPSGLINKIADTNVLPIAFPKSCFQFKVTFTKDESPWKFCNTLYKNDIMAVPLNGFIYAWGEKTHIMEVCTDKLVSDISITPFTRDSVIHNGTFKELLLKTITATLGQLNSLDYSKDKIWDTSLRITKKLGTRTITAYKGIRLALTFDIKYTYITVTPTFVYDKGLLLTSDEKKQFADWFSNIINSNKPNYNISKYVKTWTRRLLGSNGIAVSYPLNSHTGFNFKVSRNSAILGINYGGGTDIQLPNAISRNRIVFNGIECRDPELVFYDFQRRHMDTDFHPMRGLTKYAPFDYSINEKLLRTSISLGVICPQNHNKKFYTFLNQLNCRQSVKYNADFVIPFPGFYQAFKVGIDIPTPDNTEWMNPNVTSFSDIKKSSIELGNTITRKLDQLSGMAVDVVLIYIPKEYEPFTGFTERNINFDLHDYIKAYAAQKNIATQFVREKTLESDMYCQIMWALSLAIYVKSSRVPWVVSGIQQDTAFAGIGYSVNCAPSGTNIIVGCSHIYSADGQGMKYKLSKIDDVTFDRKKNPFLSEDEVYRFGLNIKELFYKSFTELPKRVVIHKRTPFRKEEIKGFIESLATADVRDIELLEITYEDNLKCFEFNKFMTDIDGFPVRRGLCFPINEKTMYLYTHGIAPSVRGTNRKYIQGGKTIPLPLKIVKHYGNGDMTQIATEILGLSKMNWNSFGLYSKLPCTIESSNEIARIGLLLSQYEGAIYDYRYFM